MMKPKPGIILGGLALAATAAFGLSGVGCSSRKPAAAYDYVRPSVGSIRVSVASTGIVKPQNRLEIKPAIGGRIDAILVKEGDRVAAGQTLALMSSTDRAALLDAARPQGPEAIDYWSQVYKATPILSPIQGTVIVRSVEPGQTVSTADSVLVLSDRLIVQASVDETDIGKVRVGQRAIITLDAYPEIHVEAQVDHIAYESTTSNNVTTYNVDILPRQVPPVFRSGMSANVDVVTAEKHDVLLLPLEAVTAGERGSFVRLKSVSGERPRRQRVTTGLADEKSVEIVTGVSAQDEIAVQKPDYSALGQKEKTNPFMPRRPRGSRGGGGSRR